MKKRPLCAICILFLVIQGIRVLFFGAGDDRLSALEETVPYESQVTLAGTVYRIEEKKKVTAVFLKDNAVSAAGQNISESKILTYISRNETGQPPDIKIGNRLKISGEAELFETARNPGNFDQRAYYKIQGIRVLVWADQVCTLSEKTYPVRQFLAQFKKAWKELLLKHLGDYYGETMSAVLLGDKSGLDAEMKSVYQKCGISHLLAISGLHMTFLGMGIYNLLRRAGCSFVLAGTVGGTLLILYSLMIGAGVSSMRALLMFLVRIGAEITGRDYDLLTSLFLSAAVLSAGQPLYLTDAGFQLSYGAILGIALFGPAFSEMFGCARIADRRKRFTEKKTGKTARLKEKCLSVVLWVLNGLSTSIAVTVLLLGPLLWFYFEIPPYSVFLNLIVIPVMPAAMGAGVIGSALSLLSDTAGGAVLKICRAVLWGYDKACAHAGSLPFDRLVTGRPEIHQIVMYYVTLSGFLICFWHLVRRREREEERDGDATVWQKLCRLPGCVMILSAAAMALMSRMGYQECQGVQVTVLDVGQGDGIHIRTSSVNCLIDGGSSDVSSVGKYRLEPYLLSQGVDCLDYVFVTHGDDDHINGIQEMLEGQDLGVRIARLVLPPVEYHDEKVTALARTAAENGTRVAVMSPGDTVISEGEGTVMAGENGTLILTCLGPEEGTGIEPGNETSLVLDLSYGEFDMLFTGDVEGAGEESLTASGRLREYDVLKAAHHGSKNSGSEEFLQITSPVCAVISAGEDNRYGHPHAETIRRFRDAGCKVYSAQDNGAVTIQSDGETMTIRGFAGGSA